MIDITADNETQVNKAIEALQSNSKLNLSNTILPFVGAKPFIKVIRAFLKDFASSLELTNEELTHQQKQKFCHKLKSASINVGATDLSARCSATEQELVSQDIDITPVFTEFKSTFYYLYMNTKNVQI